MGAITSAVVGAVGVANAVSSSRKAGRAQDRATAAAESAAAEQNALSREQFDWDRQIYERDTAPMQRRQQEMQERIANDALARAAKQDQLADEQKAYYDSTFKPIEQKVAADAVGYDSAENVNRRSGIAAANVNQQFSNARGQSARLAGRYGLGSTAFSGPAGAAERAQALGTAGASTGAAFDTMDKGIQLRAGAANFGRNMTNTALSAFSGANNSSGVAGGAANSALTGTMSATAGMNNAYGSRMAGIGSSTGLLTSALNNSARFAGGDAADWGGFAGGMLQRGLRGINARGGFGGMFGGGSGGFVDQGGMGAASNAFLAEYGI
jgi:hypothetical protein